MRIVPLILDLWHEFNICTGSNCGAYFTLGLLHPVGQTSVEH